MRRSTWESREHVMVERVRTALVGCGRIAQVAHLPAFEKAAGVELVAVSDPSREVAEAVARRYAVPGAYTSQAEALAGEAVEAVVITAPDRFHHDLASEALSAGKHVLIEKPLASTVAEAQVLVDLVEETGLVLQVGSMKRHDEGVQWARGFVGSQLGEARSFNAWYRIGDLRAGIEASLFPRMFADGTARETEAEFKADRQRYLLTTHGSHVFDTVRNLLGPLTSVVARHRAHGRDQQWQIIATTGSGAIGTISITTDVPGLPAEGIEIFGADGSVRVETHFPFYRRSSTVHAYAAGQIVQPTLTDGDAYQRQVEAFATTIRKNGRPVPDARDGLAAVRAIEATAAAVASGAEVTL